MKQVLQLEHLPSATLNVALHLVASLLVVSQGHADWETKTLDLVMVISNRRKALFMDEVEVVIGFYQELLTKLGSTAQVCKYKMFTNYYH